MKWPPSRHNSPALSNWAALERARRSHRQAEIEAIDLDALAHNERPEIGENAAPRIP